MASITTWGNGDVSVRLSLDRPDRVVVQVEDGVTGALYLSAVEAIKLRDDLSRAITEVATAAAKALQSAGEAA